LVTSLCQVLAYGRRGRITIPAAQRLQQDAMPANMVVRTGVGPVGKCQKKLNWSGKRQPRAEQPSMTRDSDELTMEREVVGLDVARVRTVGATQQLIECCVECGKVRAGRVYDGLPGREFLEGCPKRADFAQVCGLESGHKRAAVRDGRDQSLLLELEERFAYRPAACAEVLRQLYLVQACAGSKTARQNRSFENALGVLAQGPVWHRRKVRKLGHRG
jgi:hypothetical protein